MKDKRNNRDVVIELKTENPDFTQSKIARVVGLSRERVRQILASSGLQTGRIYRSSPLERYKSEVADVKTRWGKIIAHCNVCGLQASIDRVGKLCPKCNLVNLTQFEIL